eukprot:scaffold1564_cov389-Prasinococcus_capsulatus_cf.AAC.26
MALVYGGKSAAQLSYLGLGGRAWAIGFADDFRVQQQARGARRGDDGPQQDAASEDGGRRRGAEGVWIAATHTSTARPATPARWPPAKPRAGAGAAAAVGRDACGGRRAPARPLCHLLATGARPTPHSAPPPPPPAPCSSSRARPRSKMPPMPHVILLRGRGGDGC